MAPATKKDKPEKPEGDKPAKPRKKPDRKPQPCRVLVATRFKNTETGEKFDADTYARFLHQRDELRDHDPNNDLPKVEHDLSLLEPTAFELLDIPLRDDEGKEITESSKALGLLEKQLAGGLEITGWLGIFKQSIVLPGVRTTVEKKTTVKYD